MSCVQHCRQCARSCTCLGLLCARPALCCACRPGLWVATGTLCRNTTLGNPWENSVAAQRGPLLRPKHPVSAPNPVVTQNLCHDAGPKIFVATEKASVATQTAQHAWEPCRDTGPESSVARAPQSCAHVCPAHPSRVVRLA